MVAGQLATDLVLTGDVADGQLMGGLMGGLMGSVRQQSVSLQLSRFVTSLELKNNSRVLEVQRWISFTDNDQYI